MKSALHVLRRKNILPMLEISLTGFTVFLVVGSVMTVVHSGLLMVE